MDVLFATSKSFDVYYRRYRDDDFVDRLNHWYTSILLVLFAIFISAKQFFGSPITCWIPNEFSKAWKQYTENYCWIQNTYFIPHDVDLPKSHTYREEKQLSYYQWVPFVIAIQAFMFYFPRAFWRLVNWQSGINVQDMVGKAMDVCSTIRIKNDDTEKKETESNEKKELTEEELEKQALKDIPDVVKDIAHHLEFSIDSVSESKGGFARFLRTICVCSLGSRKFGFYLVTLYFITKLLYILNIIAQFFILNDFIGSSYKFFGIQALHDLVNGKDWQNTGHFPRITMCDFEIRSLGNRRNYTVQCVLSINLFNEKIYIFIWFWFVFVAVITIYSLFHWIGRMMSSQKMKFIKNLLKKRISSWGNVNEDLLEIFVNKRLKSDGLLLIYLIYINAGDIVTKELLDVLWYRHNRRYQDKIKSGMSNEGDYDDNTYML